MELDFKNQKDESFMAMQSAGTFQIQFLLSTGRTRSGRCEADEPDRRAVYADAVLRKPEDGGVFKTSGTCGESETSSEIDEGNGDRGDLPRTQYQPASDGTCGVSVFVEKSFNHASESGLERGYYVHPTLSRICISGGDSRLVFPIRSVLETLEQFGDGILYGDTRRGIGASDTGYFQHGSGMSVYERGFHETFEGERNPDQHGLTGPGLRQYLYGETLEERQIRGCLSERLSDHDGGSGRIEEIFSVLQPRKISPVSGLQNTGGGSWNHRTGKEVVHISTVIHRERKKEAKKERDLLRLVHNKNCLDNGVHLRL